MPRNHIRSGLKQPCKEGRVAHRWTTQTITATHPAAHRRACRHARRNGAPGGTGTWSHATSYCSKIQSLTQRALSSTPRNWTAEYQCGILLSSMKGTGAGGVHCWTLAEMLRLPQGAIAGMVNVMQVVKSLSRSPPRSASTLWPCRASQMELAKGLSRSLGAFRQSSRTATKKRSPALG